MGAVGEAYDEARLAVSENATDIFAELSTITVPGAATRDSFGEDVAGTATTIENVPCDVEAMSAMERATAAATVGTADHRLLFPFYHQGAFLSVPTNASVTVHAHGLHPARTFQVTGPMQGSKDIKQRIAATFQQ